MHISAKIPALAALMGAAFCHGAGAQNLKIQQLANPDLINRNPSISETGLIAWQQTDPTTSGGANSAIILYRNDKTETLSAGLTGGHSANISPKASGNRLVWQTAFLDTGAVTPTWQLKQVPLGTNEIPELHAVYNLENTSGGDAHQVYTNSVGEVRTNSLIGSESIPDWNFFTGHQKWTPTTNSQHEVDGDGRALVRDPQDSNRITPQPAGTSEIMMWDPTNGMTRITVRGGNDLNPSMHQSLIAWQKAKRWPFGWEIMHYDGQERFQLTTNYFYDMAPEVKDGQVAWYGWDGNDFEIFLYDHETKVIKQLTDNTFDDVSPVLDGGVVVWEAYPAVEADIYLWKEGQDVLKLSDNIEDDLNPRISAGQVVWQGFDGDDFEIYRYDGEKTIKLTGNDYDDLNPEIHDGLICWMGYEENWDSEIFYWNGGDIITLTSNDFDDRYPKTAGGKIVWQAEELEKSYIYLASP